jgi:formylglycine-generating enzyme required for sulfatase activity
LAQVEQKTSVQAAMNQRPALHETLTFHPLLGFAFSLPETIGLIPSVEAASPSASARIINKLRKKIATLKKQLAAAKAVPAPFLEMVTVGNAGNGTDSGNESEPNIHGAVSGTFQTGKFEVTNSQYTAFLTAVAATDTYGRFNVSMETDVRGGSWFNNEGTLRPYYQEDNIPGFEDDTIGFRVAGP